MRASLLAAVVLLASCKKDSPVAAVPSPPAAPAPERKSPLEEIARADGVLSVFEPAKDGCEWRRVDTATKKAVVVASFPGSCRGASVSWSSDGTTAAVWFDPKLVQSSGYGGSDVGAPGHPDETPDPAAKDRLYSVKIATGAVKEFPRPSAEVDELGVTPKGEVLALSLETLGDAAMAAGKTTVDGKDFALKPVEEGLPALAHAWQLSGTSWTRVETAQTTTGWDYGRGVSELEAEATFGPRSVKLLETHPGEAGEVDEATQAKLKAFAPKKGDGSWAALGAAGTRAFTWVITAEFGYTTGLLVFEAGKLHMLHSLCNHQ